MSGRESEALVSPLRHDRPNHGVLPLPSGRRLPHHRAYLARTESDAVSNDVENVVSVITSASFAVLPRPHPVSLMSLLAVTSLLSQRMTFPTIIQVLTLVVRIFYGLIKSYN